MQLPAILRVAATTSLLTMTGLSAHARTGPFYYLSPVPGAHMVNPGTPLILRPDPEWAHAHPGWERRVSIIGSESGTHTGRCIHARDAKTIVIEPDAAFTPGEMVTVTVSADGFSYHFVVSALPGRPDPRRYECTMAPRRAGRAGPAAPRGGADSLELPVDFPAVHVVASHDPSPGMIFLTDFGFTDLADPSVPHYLLILRNDGTPEFFRKTPGPGALDFRVQPDGRLSYFLSNSNHFYFLDDTYTMCDSIEARGYPTDGHDLALLPGGGVLLMASDPQIMDMGQLVEGGVPDALVIGAILQEFDADGNLVFQWRSWDHFDILDATELDFTHSRIDYVHANAIEIDDDGGILLSCRHMDEITKIDRDTGDIVWRLGGRHNEFTLVGDSEWFSHQHDVRRLPGGTLTMFDNGNYREPQESRAVEYRVDEAARTVTRVWEYRHDPPVYGLAMGNAQRLADGSTLVGWGSTTPALTEVRRDGSTALEMSFDDGVFSYRARRYDWHGVAAAPTLWARTDDGRLVLHFVTFGDERAASYTVYRGDPPERVAETQSGELVVHGFEAGERLVFRVTFTRDHRESPYSNTLVVTPGFADDVIPARVAIEPRTLNAEAAGEWIAARIELDAGGAGGVFVDSVVIDGRVRAARVSVHGRGAVRLDARFPRDAVVRGLDPGVHDLRVAGAVGGRPFEGYGRLDLIDPAARAPGPAHRAGGPPPVDLLPNHPNPFNPATTIRFSLREPHARVTVDIFDVAGGRVRVVFDGPAAAGEHSLEWDGRDDHAGRLPAGVYFCRLRADGAVSTRKLVLVK